MSALLEAQGFLGTGASLLADLTLAAYVVLLLPAMLVGFVFARRGRHRPHHKWVMIVVTLVNWALIAFLMIATFRADVAPNLAGQAANPRYWLPAVHGLFGLPAQLLATFIVVRMLLEDYQVARARQRGDQNLSRYWFKGAKWTMRLVLFLWIITASLGIVTYLARYNVLTLPGSTVSAPASTPEVMPMPAATEDVG